MGDGGGKRVYVVTGANTGIGKATAAGLAKHGGRVAMVSRDAGKGQAAIDDVRASNPQADLELVVGDLGTLTSTRALAADLLARFPRIDVLVNNAGVWPGERRINDDGYEQTFAVNHLAPFLLTNLLLDRLAESGSARVVNVSSALHTRGRIHFDDLHVERRPFKAMQVYADSKLANVLFTRELARRVGDRGVVTHAVHPGVVQTDLSRNVGPVLKALWRGFGRVFFKSPERGAATSIHVALDPAPARVNGRYFADSRERKPAGRARDDAAASRLWRVSEELTGLA